MTGETVQWDGDELVTPDWLNERRGWYARVRSVRVTVHYNHEAKAQNPWFTEPTLAVLTPALRERAGRHMLPLEAERLRHECHDAPCTEVAELLDHMSRSGEYDVDKLYRSAAFWGVLVQMPPGDPRISVLPMFVHMAAGEFEMAMHHMRLLSIAKSDLVLPNPHAARIALRKWSEVLGARVEEGIALHEAGKLDEAIEHYDSLLDVVGPNAWLMHERNQSRLMGGASTDEEGPIAVDPLFHLMTVSIGQDAMQEAMLRLRMSALFRDPARFLEDTDTKADVALRLGEYGFAGLSYWWLTQAGAVEPRTGMDTLVYCIHESGAPTDDWSKASKQIKRTRKRLRRG